MAVHSADRRPRRSPTPIAGRELGYADLTGWRYDAAPPQPLTGPAHHATAARPRHSDSRLRAVLLMLGALDVGIAAIAALAGVVLRFGEHPADSGGVPSVVLVSCLPAVWSLTVLLAGGYDRRCLLTGPDEFRRIVNSGVWLLAAIAFLDFAGRLEVSRGFVAITVPLVTAFTVIGRGCARTVLQRHVMGGHPLHRVVVVGSPAEVRDLIRHMRRSPQAGYEVVGACLDGGPSIVEVDGGAIPVLGGPVDALEVANAVDADTLAVAGTSAVGSRHLRELSWQMEGSGIQLMVAPALTDVAGPRIVARPVAGLPLLHVEEPAFTGARRLLKAIIARLAAVVLAILLAPVLAILALAVRLTSPGPVFFRQVRVGLNGRRFAMWKFRTMCAGADAIDLDDLNEQDGPLFKVRQDPRVTPLGRWLRKYSLDELPQLWNVIDGSMSLVGPRPPLPGEVDRYETDARRRLLVKPGLTGLWQVSGRSDLSWEEAVRLDLYYIENWSVGMDVMVLWKTLSAVLSGQGAY